LTDQALVAAAEKAAAQKMVDAFIVQSRLMSQCDRFSSVEVS
jgi:hypothetical protein